MGDISREVSRGPSALQGQMGVDSVATASENFRRCEGLQVNGHQRVRKTYKESKRSHQSSTLRRLGEAQSQLSAVRLPWSRAYHGNFCKGVTEEQLSGQGEMGNQDGTGQVQNKNTVSVRGWLLIGPQGALVCPVEKGQALLQVSWSLASAHNVEERGSLGRREGLEDAGSSAREVASI